MQKWEYHMERIPRNWELKLSDGTKFKGDGAIFGYLSDALGQKGWEMVSVAPETQAGGYTTEWLFVFKRPIESSDTPAISVRID